jgi:HAD superfamily hydrolase (TIGR01509 family)
MNPKAVIYDMDGLLVNSEPLWHQAEKEVFEEVGVYLSTEDCYKTIGIPSKEVIAYWYKKMPWTLKTPEEVEENLYRKIRVLLAQNAEAMPGVYETLSFFKQANIKIGLASASPLDLIEIVLEKLQVKAFFDFYHSATLEKNNKPHPDVYLTVAKNLQTAIEDCLILEDSVNGVKGAKASGASVIAVPDPHLFEDTVYEIADKKVKNLLEILPIFQT